MTSLEALRVKIFADGADVERIRALYAKPYIKGFTTNPTLMRKAGVTDYRTFAKDVLVAVPDRPISFEVCSDDLDVMEEQAREIASWGNQVYVKIPITDTRRAPMDELVGRLSSDGVKVNVTAVLTLRQVERIVRAVHGGAPCCISVFAGRIADTGRDPVPIMTQAVQLLESVPHAELIWASPRELLNVFQADAIGCDIITVTSDILAKLTLVDKDLEEFSLETVQMFHSDAKRAGFSLTRRSVQPPAPHVSAEGRGTDLGRFRSRESG